MSIIVTDAAEADMLSRILNLGLTIKLFKNDVTDGLTAEEIEALVAGDFTEATFTGYAAGTIVFGDWTITEDDPGTAVAPEETFEASADQASQTIYGYYVVKTSGGALQWFELLTTPTEIQNDNDSIKITPRFTLKDEVDA